MTRHLQIALTPLRFGGVGDLDLVRSAETLLLQKLVRHLYRLDGGVVELVPLALVRVGERGTPGGSTHREKWSG